MTEEKDPKGYVVRDRRRFDVEGNQREEESRETRQTPPAAAAPPPQAPRPAPPQAAPPQAAQNQAAQNGGSTPSARARRATEQVDFSQLVLSIATNAMISLEGTPSDGRLPGGRPNLPAAEQNIGILIMLEEKTRGNLTPEEAELIKSVLYDLRMQYVAIQQALGGA